MSDEIPPWETPMAIQARIQTSYEEQERRRLAENDAIMDRTLDMAEHLPDYDLDGDCCSGTTLYINGCSCGVTGVHDEESWKEHVAEVQRRDRVAVWDQAIAYAEHGGEPHGMPWKNPYRDQA